MPIQVTPSAMPPVIGAGINISTGGMGLMISQNLKLGDFLALEFTLPGRTQKIRVKAQVKMCVPLPNGSFKIGAEFYHLSPGDEVVIANYVAGALSV